MTAKLLLSPQSIGRVIADTATDTFDDRMWPLDGGPERVLEMPPGWQSKRATFSPDGRWVAQGVHEVIRRMVDGKPWVDDEPRGVVIHEVATGKRAFTLPTGHSGPIRFTPDSRGLVVTTQEGITRWDLVTQRPLVAHEANLRCHGSYGASFASCLALTTDGNRAITGHIDTTALVWDITPPIVRPRALTAAEMTTAWNDLAGADVGKAYRAVWAIADSGDEAAKFLRDRLRPTTAPPDETVRKLVEQLGEEDFTAREKAEQELRELGDAVAPALRAALKTALSAEQRQRIDTVLAAASPPLLSPGDRLRQVRAVGILEAIGTNEARELVSRLAEGKPEARLTREAKLALDRLRANRR